MATSEALKLRHEALLEEQARRKNGMPLKALVIVSVLLSLLAVGVSFGITNPVSIAAGVAVAVILVPIAINALCFRLDLRDTAAELLRVRS